MSDVKRKSRANALACIADGFIEAEKDPTRASRALATKLASFRPTQEELRRLGVSDKQLQNGFELIRRNKREPRHRQLDKFMSARSTLLANLSIEPTRRRPRGGHSRIAVPRTALR